MRRVVGLAVGLLLVMGCPSEDDPVFTGTGADTSGPGGAPDGKGIGEDCGTSSECRPGLTCAASGTCEPAMSQAAGQSCYVGAECQAGLICAPPHGCYAPQAGISQPDADCETDADCAPYGEAARCMHDPLAVGQECQAAGDAPEGGACTLDKDCQAGLRCTYTVGFTGTCAPTGETDIGGECTSASDCYGGLVCGAGNTCQTWLQALQQAAQWPGEECEAEPSGDARAFFEVPRADGTPPNDFYRLPFPNDIRLASGYVTTGHPAPGAAPLEFDVVQRVLDAAQAIDGFGTTPTVFFRFSHGIDFATIKTGADVEDTIRFVNIDPDSPGYSHSPGYVWGGTNGRGKFTCNNLVTVHNHYSNPLSPGTTYAVFILKGVKSDGVGAEFQADADLQAVLGDGRPGDPQLGEAWDQYAPLRAYLADQAIPVANVITAAVFTTVTPTTHVEAARDVVREQDLPSVKDLTICGEGVESPCATEGDDSRVCGNNPDYYEIHGRLTLPTFQQGERPYLDPADGGGLALGQGGAPLVTGTEDVCFALTIPKIAVPAEGWPVVLFSHGTGGNFRSHVANGTAGLISVQGGATLGIDGVMHGPRRGSDLDPEALFFNFANPKAARGNVYQAAFDFFALTRFVEDIDIQVDDAVIDFDPAKIGFMGHSQGATTGPLFLAFEPLVGAAVLSGAGSGLLASLLNKTSPVSVPAALEAVLREPGSETQPVLSILQQYFDPVDSVNYAQLIGRHPPEGVPPKHLLLVVGSGDTYTPPRTARILADNLGIQLAGPAVDAGMGEAFEGYPMDLQVSPPVSGNAIFGDAAVTQVMVHHVPDDYDGHFVAFRNPAARSQIGGFFGSFFQTGVAELIAP